MKHTCCICETEFDFTIKTGWILHPSKDETLIVCSDDCRDMTQVTDYEKRGEILGDGDHERAIRLIDRFMTYDPEPASIDGKRLVSLAKIVQSYEAKKYPQGEAGQGG